MLLGMLLGSASVPALELSGQISIGTEWIDRGISQTAGEPALQAGLEIAAESGAYLGAWAGNVDFGDCCSERVQLDWTAGIAGHRGGLEWDAGLTWSTLPGASGDPEFVEYYLGLGWRGYGFGASWTPDFAGLGRELWYLEINRGFQFPIYELRLSVHAGYTHGSALHRRYANETGLEPYADWQLALERDFGRVTATLGWADTDMGGDFRVRDSVEHNDGRLFLMLSASFP